MRSRINAYEHNKKFLTQKLMIDEQRISEEQNNSFVNYVMSNEFKRKYYELNQDTVILGAKKVDDAISKFDPINGIEGTYNKIRPFFDYVANINDHLKKQQSGNELINNARRINKAINYSMIETKANASIQTLNNAYNNFKNADSFYVFDTETLSGMGSTGYNELDKLQELSFRKFKKVNGKLEEVVEDRLETLVGLNDSEYKHYYDVFIKNFNDRGWEGNQKYEVIAKRLAKLGHEDTTLDYLSNGAVVTKTFASDESKDLMSRVNIERGLKRSLEIGEHQSKNKLANGLTIWEDQVLRSTSIFNNNFVAGYNSTNFDFEKMNQQVATIWRGLNSDQKSYYAKELGLKAGQIPTINPTAGNYLDFRDVVRIGAEKIGKTGIYDNDDNALSTIHKLKATLLQQEALGEIFAKDAMFTAAHTAGADVTTLAHLLGGKSVNGGSLLDKLMVDINNNASNIKGQVGYDSILMATQGEFFNDFTRKGALNFTHDRSSGNIRTFNGFSLDSNGDVRDLGKFGKATGIKKNVAYKIGFMGEMDMSEEWVNTMSSIHQDYAQGKLWSLTLNPVIDKNIAGSNHILEDPTTYFFTSKEAMEGFVSSHFAHIGNIDTNGNFSELADKAARDEVKKLFGVHTIKEGKISEAAEQTIDDLVSNGTKQLMNDSAARMIRENEYTKAVKFNKLQDYLIKNGAATLDEQKAMLSLATAEKVASGQALKIQHDVLNILGYHDMSAKKQVLYSSTLNNTINSYEYMSSRRNVTNMLIDAVKEYGDIGSEKQQFIYDNLLRNLRDDLAGRRVIDAASKEDLINNAMDLQIYGKDLDYFEFDLPEYFKNTNSKAMVGEIDDVLRVNLKAEKEYSLVNELLRRRRGNDDRLKSKEMRQAYGMLELKNFMTEVNEKQEYLGIFDNLLEGTASVIGRQNANNMAAIEKVKEKRTAAVNNMYSKYNSLLDEYISQDSNVQEQRNKVLSLIEKRNDIIKNKKRYVEELSDLSKQFKIYPEQEWEQLSDTVRQEIKDSHKSIQKAQQAIIDKINMPEQLEKQIEQQYYKLFDALDSANVNAKANIKDKAKEIRNSFGPELDSLYSNFKYYMNDGELAIDADISVDALSDKVIQAIKEFRNANPTSGYSKTRTYQNVLGEDALFANVDLDEVKKSITKSKDKMADLVLLDAHNKDQVKTYAEKLVDDVLMPTVTTKDGVVLKSIDDITTHAQKLYGYNTETAKLFRHNLELQRTAHVEAMTDFISSVGSAGGLISYNKVSKDIGLNIGTEAYNLYGLPRTVFENGVLFHQIGQQRVAANLTLDAKSIMSGNRISGKAEIKSGLKDAYSEFKYLGYNINRARNRGENPGKAIIRSISNVSNTARELSALGMMNIKDTYAWQNLDLSEAITALPNILPEMKAYKGWQDPDFIEIIERNKNRIAHGNISSEVKEAFAKNKQDVVKILTGIGAGAENHKRTTTEFIISQISNYTKDGKLSEGKTLMGQYSPMALTEFDNPSRPPITAANGILFSKDKLQKKLEKAGRGDVEIGSRLVSTRQNAGRVIDGIGEVESGVSFINASISEKEFKKKVNKALNDRISKATTESEKNRLEAIKKQMGALNLTEQGKILDGRVADAMLSTTETQRISTYKNFVKDLSINDKVMNKRLAKSMPVLEIAQQGDIVFKLGEESFVKKGDPLFAIEAFGDIAFDTIGVKEDAGLFGYKYFAKGTDLEVDEDTISKFLNKNKKSIIGSDGKLDYSKVQSLLDKEYDSSFYVKNAFIKGYNKGTIEYAEKGMYDALLSGAGTIDDNVAKALKAMGFENAQGKILSESFIDVLEGAFNDADKSKVGFKSFEDLKKAINAEKFAMTDFFRSIEGFEDVTAISVDNIIKHGNAGLAMKNFINEIAYNNMTEGVSKDEAYKQAFETIKKAGVFEGVDFKYEDGKIVFDSINDPLKAGISIDKVKELSEKLGFYTKDSKFAITDDNGNVVGYKSFSTTYFNEDFSGTSRSSFEKNSIKKALDDTRKQLKVLSDDDPTKHELADKVNSLEHAYNVAKKYDKTMTISSRETDMLSLYGYDDKIMKNIKSRLGEDEYNKIYGHMLDDTGRLTAKYNDANVNQFFIDDIKSYAREQAKAHKDEFDDSLKAIVYNADPAGQKEHLLNNGFKEVKSLNDLVLPNGSDARTLSDPNSTIGKKLLIDTGLTGNDRYVAVSTSMDYESDEVQKALGKLKYHAQVLEDGKKGVNGALAGGKTIADLEANVKSAVANVRESMEGSTRNILGKLDNVQLGGYAYEKATMIADSKYHMFNTSIINGKTVGEWAEQGVHYDASWHGRQYFENLGYFDKKVWKDQFGMSSVDEMVEHLSKYGTAGVELRTPTINEGSLGITHQFLDTTMKDGQTRSTASLVFARNQDHDGDSIIQAELRHKETGMTFAEFQYKQREGLAIPDSAKEYFDSMNAAQTYRATTINNKVVENVANNLYDDTSSAVDSLNVNKVLDSKKVNLNGHTVTAYSQFEADTATRNHYLQKYGEIESAVSRQLGEKQFNALTDIERAKALESHISTLATDLQDDYRQAAKFVEILGKDNAAVMSKTAGKASIGYINTPLALMRRAGAVEGLSRDERQYLQSTADVLEQNIISRKHSVDTSISLAQTFRTNLQRMFDGDTSAVGEINELIQNNYSEEIIKKVRTFTNLADVDKLSDEQILNNVTNTMSNLASMAHNNSNFKNLIMGENASRVINGSNYDQVLRGLSEQSTGLASELAKEGYGSYTRNSNAYIDLDGYSAKQKSKLAQAAGSAVEEMIQGVSGSGLAKAALGLAAAVMMTGYIGGNPTVPADNQAQQMDNYESLQDEDLSIQQLPQGTGQGYVININAQSNKGQEHVAQAIQKAMQSSVTTDINIAMSMNDNTSIINSRTLDKLMSRIM